MRLGPLSQHASCFLVPHIFLHVCLSQTATVIFRGKSFSVLTDSLHCLLPSSARPLGYLIQCFLCSKSSQSLVSCTFICVTGSSDPFCAGILQVGMAEALISSLMSTIIGNLNSLVLEELGFVGGLKTEFQILESTLSTIQAVIHDAEEKMWTDEAVKNWLRKLKDAAYDARDVLEEFSMEAQRHRQQRGVKNQVRSFFSVDHNPIAFRVRMAGELKNVMARLDNIAEERRKFHLRERTGGDVEVVKFDWRQTGSLVNDSDIYGRKKEREELIVSLLSNSGALSVHAICGMGGLGKTTLAQLVYNHAKVEEHFPLRVWVCISVVHFELKKLISAIIENIEGGACDAHELDTLLRRLQQNLSGRRFLLVLDDIWDYDFEKWSRLNDVLIHGAKGSAVIITTRDRTVALKMATVGVRDLETLSDEDSWSLFQSRAFRNQRPEEYAHLEAIGKEIVKKCGGLPLAIKAMGSMMYLKRKEDEWLSIRESNIWDLPEEGSMILPALRLSYDHLPSHLRQCFAFCSVFPKDWEMRKDTLIQLWMANGFFPNRAQMDLHDLGNEVFNELIRRSFFQDVEEHHESGITTCKMHDLVHDLAESITTDEFRFLKDGDNIRPLAVYMGFLKDGTPNRIKTKMFEVPDSHFFSKQKRLRVVAISSFDKLPITSICRLKHLRYLDLSFSSIKTLPDSVCSLQNLETLVLSFCTLLHMLPHGLKQLKSLVYLDITECFSLRCMPAGMGGMTRLRKLSMFIVGKEDGHHIMELKDLNLGGHLSITNLHNVTDSVDARSANLILKRDLYSLQLSWQKYGGNNQHDNNQHENNEDVLQGLQPYSNLKKLSIDLYSGTKFPSWIMNLLLPNLVNISLNHCCNCKYLPPFGKLQFLRQLQLINMDAVVIIDDGLYGGDEVAYPSLESMYIYSMMGLEQWLVSPGRNICPRLREFTLLSCPKLADLPVFPRVKNVTIGGREVTLLKSATNFPSLATIMIENSPDVTHLPDGVMINHKFVEELKISNLQNLESLSNQLDNLSALKHLEISRCYKLESLPEGLKNLNRLEKLNIFVCEELHSLPVLGFSGFSSLRRLSIRRCDKLACLSEGLRHLTSLEYLNVSRCPNLSSLPESVLHLTSLQILEIEDCKALSLLPNDIGYLTSLSSLTIGNCPNLRSLPDGMQNLTRLETLAINGCPYLERSCRKKGKDWVNIAHIPSNRIDSK